MNTAIRGLAHYLPERIVDNAWLAKQCGIDRAFLNEKVGIRCRHIAAENEATSSMAIRAAQRLIEKTGVAPETFDLLIVCTQNPDYRLPTTACLVQAQIGSSSQCAALDINLGCSGYVYALALADGMLKARYARHALLLMADQYSRLIDYQDKNTAALFGDAATATWLAPGQDGVGIVDVMLNTDGRGAMNLVAPNSGVVRDPTRSKYLFMDGREIFRFAITTVPVAVRALLDRHQLDTAQIRAFIFHQANQYLLREIQKQLALRDDQMVIEMADTGNTVSSTIPLALEPRFDRGDYRSGDRLVFCGFGVGLSWGTLLYVVP